MPRDLRAANGIQRVTIDLPPMSMARLHRLRGVTEASSFGEVIRAALLVYEEGVFERAAKIKAEAGRKPVAILE